MLVVSIGTGTSSQANDDLQPGAMNLLYNARSIPSALMLAASNEQDFLCRVFGKTLCGIRYDREIGDLIAPLDPVFPGGQISGWIHPKMFAYLRYNADLTRAGLDALNLRNIVPEHIQAMDSTDHIQELKEVGDAVARQKVRSEHLEGSLKSAARSRDRKLDWPCRIMRHANQCAFLRPEVAAG